MNRAAFWLLGTALALCTGTAHAAIADDDAAREPILVTAPGSPVDRNDTLGLSGEDIGRAGPPDLLASLTRSIAGITLQDAQGNPWQPNLAYRGFTASPLQGQPQGLAVYLDGARFNQPFGDTVAFDLLPEAAIRHVTLFDSNAVYGLNALGGAMVIETKTGASDPGLEASLSAGRFGMAEATLAGGWQKGDLNGFAAFQYSHEDGWRAHSPSSLAHGYFDFGIDREAAGLHLKLIGADTDLTGNGVAPVELLAANRRAVFTWPDNSRARYGRVSLHPWIALGNRTRIEATLYAQHLRLRTVNGDAADIEACEEADATGLLCLKTADEGEAAILTDRNGLPIADQLGGEGYGVLNRGHARTRAAGALVQIIDTHPLFSLPNHLAIGLSHDSSRTRFDSMAELGALTEQRSVEGLGPVIAQSDGAIAPVALVTRTRYWGLFLQDRLSLTSRLSVEIGLRYNHARVQLNDRIGTALNGLHHFGRLNPGIEFDYAVNDILSLRAGYATSNRVPTPAELSCADEAAPCSLANFFIADPPLKQVVAQSWKAGASARGSIAGFQVEALLSAWRTDSRNDIQHVASAIRGRAWFRNIGSARRQGVEMSLRAKRGGFTGTLGYAFTDARYRHAFMISSPANPAADENGAILVEPGDRIAGVPRHSAALSLDYSGRGWSVGGDLIARSGQFLAGDEGNENAQISGYAIFNLRAGVDIRPGLTLFGELRNVFDRRYATFGTFTDVGEVDLAEAPGATNPRAYGPGAPRRWQAGIKARF